MKIMAKFQGIKQYISPVGHNAPTKTRAERRKSKSAKLEAKHHELLEKIDRVAAKTPMDILEAVILWLPKAQLNEHDRMLADQIMLQYTEWQEVSHLSEPKANLDDDVSFAAPGDPFTFMAASTLRNLMRASMQSLPQLTPSYNTWTPVGPNQVHASQLSWTRIRIVINGRTGPAPTTFFAIAMDILEPIAKAINWDVNEIYKHIKITPTTHPDLRIAKLEEERRRNIAKRMADAVVDMSTVEAQLLDQFLNEVIIRGQ